ncbi:transcriptional regulator [Nesterenkonia lutea]|uniref:DNA-binding MarR family transcriptional regulator n=1 Tax=Nesterenkonia lutea TaxID=272919 RepID=A0ABR9JDI6_9MICC|nr:transcriptional regulator [Nesterenkonia lutea]MBE1523989.1 DNA-binding MarR family transcriptional regulator [Nesterenkonia lutea]
MTPALGPAFNNTVHSPVRLRICGLLRRVPELEFAVIRETLELTDANLSKNLRVLSEAGLVTVRKERSLARADSRRLTWVALTEEGRGALEGHLAALKAIADGP